jgi:predicted O-methyltransferase YrrM
MIKAVSRLLGRLPETALELDWMKRGGWLGRTLPTDVPAAPRKSQIEALADATNRLGEQPLAAEYGEPSGVRTPDGVRSSSMAGDLYAWLVQQRRPRLVVEFGSAFGVSGMYFVAALTAVGSGTLYSFELNRAWADIAERNIRAIGDRFVLTRGTFEDCVAAVVPAPIDFALVDGIHTYEFVMRQYALLRRHTSPGALIAFDDIDFARPGARMDEAWREIAMRPEVVAAVSVRRRVGLVELAG